MNEKQKLFADEYLVDLNATQAAIRAGYSVKTANEQGCRLLANRKIRAYIDVKMAQRSKRTGVTQERVLRELARIAFVKASDVIDLDSATVIDDASDDDAAVISSVKVKQIPTSEGMGVEREIRLVDKIKALELLGKHLSMFTDKIEQTGELAVKVTGEISVEDKMRAVKEFSAEDIDAIIVGEDNVEE